MYIRKKKNDLEKFMELKFFYFQKKMKKKIIR